MSTNEDGSAPFTLFSNQISDRGTNGAALTELFIAANPAITPQGTNVVILDDFYQSASGYLHTVPVEAGSFATAEPAASGPITVSSITKSGSTVNVSWSSTSGAAYRIESRSSLTGGGWNVVKTGILASRNSNSASFSASTTTGMSALYRIVLP